MCSVYFIGDVMATSDKSLATSVDVLSAEERKIIVDALKLKHASVHRAIKAASNEAVAAAYDAESQRITELMYKFR